MSRRHVLAAIVLSIVWMHLAPGRAAAQKVYKWTDKDGKAHFSNVAPSSDATADDGSGVTGIEAQGSEAPPPAAEPQTVSEGSAPAPAPASGSSSDAISNEAFSSRVSITRSRLRRDLAAAKQQSLEAAQTLAEMKKEREQPTEVGIEILQKAYGPNQGGGEEDRLLKQKEEADAKIDAIRKEYAALHGDAVKRLGGEPSWWLPLD